jgi:hypothetical protein
VEGGGIFGEDCALDLFFGVAGGQEGARAEGPAHDDGVVVVGGSDGDLGFGGGLGGVNFGWSGDGVGVLGPEDLGGGAVPVELFAARFVDD